MCYFIRHRHLCGHDFILWTRACAWGRELRLHPGLLCSLRTVMENGVFCPRCLDYQCHICAGQAESPGYPGFLIDAEWEQEFEAKAREAATEQHGQSACARTRPRARLCETKNYLNVTANSAETADRSELDGLVLDL